MQQERSSQQVPSRGQVIDTGPISDGTEIAEPVMQLLKNKKGDGSSFAFTAPIEDESDR